VPFVCIFISEAFAKKIVGPVPFAVKRNSIFVMPATNIYASIRGGRLSEAEERAVSASVEFSEAKMQSKLHTLTTMASRKTESFIGVGFTSDLFSRRK
jgi:hypothetical protein